MKVQDINRLLNMNYPITDATVEDWWWTGRALIVETHFYLSKHLGSLETLPAIMFFMTLLLKKRYTFPGTDWLLKSFTVVNKQDDLKRVSGQREAFLSLDSSRNFYGYLSRYKFLLKLNLNHLHFGILVISLGNFWIDLIPKFVRFLNYVFR